MPSTAIPTIAEHVHAAGGTDEDKVVVVVDQAHQKQSWLGIFWDTADLSREERRLLFKVDASLLIFASVSPFLLFFAWNEPPLIHVRSQFSPDNSLDTLSKILIRVT